MAVTATQRRRAAMLIVVVGAALIAEHVVSGDATDPGPEAQPAVPAESRAAPPQPAAPANESALRLDRLEAREAARGAQADTHDAGPDIVALFEPRSWQPPAPPAPPPPPPPRPTAPPFPYLYLGGMFDGDARTAFFAKGERVLTLRAGDTVDDTYRIDEMTDSQMALTYLPLNEAQTVALRTPR